MIRRPWTPVFPRLYANLPLPLYWLACWVITIPWAVLLVVLKLVVPPRFIPEGWRL